MEQVYRPDVIPAAEPIASKYSWNGNIQLISQLKIYAQKDGKRHADPWSSYGKHRVDMYITKLQ